MYAEINKNKNKTKLENKIKLKMKWETMKINTTKNIQKNKSWPKEKH